MSQTLLPLTLFYDGACPLCQAEILYLQRRNQRQLLQFIDINSNAFDPERVGVSCQAALDQMVGQIEGQAPIHGVPVFAEAYRRANLPILAWIFSRKTLRPILNLAYRIFAKNRHAISGAIGPFALKLVQRINQSPR